MSKKIRSMRGEILDLDLMKVREMIASTPVPVDVQRRADFIERKRRRRLKVSAVETTPLIDVEPDLPSEEFSEQGKEQDVNDEKVVDTKEQKMDNNSSTKQKARRHLPNKE